MTYDAEAIIDYDYAAHKDQYRMPFKIGQFCEYQFNPKEKNSEIQFFKLHFAIFITEAVY